MFLSMFVLMCVYVCVNVQEDQRYLLQLSSILVFGAVSLNLELTD